MAIALPGPDRLPPGPVRDFVVALHNLYDLAGRLAARQISRQIYDDRNLEAVSHETVSAALRGSSVPSWHKVLSIITVLARHSIRPLNTDQLVVEFHALWILASATPAQPARTDFRVRAARPEPPALPTQSFRAPDTVLTATELVVGDLPERNSFFTGRQDLLDQMSRRSGPRNAPIVLYGLAGVGKTQLASEYIHRHADRYAVRWWIRAEELDRARASLVNLAKRLGVPTDQSESEIIASLRGRLESHQIDYLIVFDGADSDQIRQLIPSIGGTVIVTSRDPSWAHDSANVGIEVMDFDIGESVQFLRKRDSRMTGDQARELIGRVGRSPLALEQMIKLRAADGRQWSDLLRDFDERAGWSLAAVTRPRQYPYTATALIEAALARLAVLNRAAMPLAHLVAAFSSEPISVAMLRFGAQAAVSPALKDLLANPLALSRAVADLNRCGLARLRTADQHIEVPPLIRLAMREVFGADALRQAGRDVAEILIAADPGPPADIGPWERHHALAPHVRAAGLVTARQPGAQAVVQHQIRFRLLTGDHVGAAELAKAAVTAWREPGFLGPDHERVLLATRDWADARRALGEYAESAELTGEAMRRLEAVPGYAEDHDAALGLAQSRTHDLRISGAYTEALELARTTYERWAGLHGTDDDRAVTCHRQMGAGLRLVGDFDAAAAVDNADVDCLHRKYGVGDSRALPSLSGLAEDLYGLGRYQEVIELWPLLRDPERWPMCCGRRGYLQARRIVALARRRLGDVARAAYRLGACHHDCLIEFGADDEITLAATMSYGNALRDLRQPERAYDHAVRATEGYEDRFGTENPLTLAARVNQAAAMRARGERRRARQLDEATCQALANTVGDRHPFTIAALVNLGADMAWTGDRDGALEMSGRAYAAALQAYGPVHYSTLAAAANLTLDTAGAMAAPVTGLSLDSVLADLRRTIGSGHPVVADVAGGARLELDLDPPSIGA